MATSLVDSPAGPDAPQSPPNGSAEPPAPHEQGSPTPAVAVRNCAKCGAPMLDGQDWCLQCGAGAPGSLGTPGWRSAGAIVGAVAVLVLGAAAAGYAALSKGTPRARVLTTTVAQVAPAPSTPATTPSTPATTPSTPGSVGKAGTKLPSIVKPPKIPLTAITPKASEKAAATTPSSEAKASTPTSTTPSGSTTTGTGTTGEGAREEAQSAILLDTNAATTYNPYDFPASWFGDPSLAIDGDTATAWSAQVNPETAPKMAEGLLIDLKAKQKVAVLQLVTSTPGMTVQVYGATGHVEPASITDPAWVPLSASRVIRKKHVRFKLRDSKKAFTYITLWISNAPASSLGSAAAPGHVDVNELELFPATSS